MPITLLLDLDDTLLETNVDAFLPAYYGALAEDLCDLVPQEAILAALRAGVQRMMLSHDAAHTLQQVFEAEFFPRLVKDADPLRARILQFYREVFPSLRRTTHQREGARELVDWAVSAGHHIALATDPVFPMAATAERVRWAGLDPARFDLISAYESFHFTKTHPAYFAEVLGRLGWPDEPVIMAGNDVDRDLGAAGKLGLTTFLVDMSSNGANQRSGNLTQLREWIQENESSLRPPAFETPEAVLAVLEATPAAMQGLTTGLSAAAWAHEASPDDWAMVELVCHLRDTDLEVHSPQITELLEAPVPFVARPDAAVWAKQRRYLSEDGARALDEFASARAASVDRLRNAPAEAWSKRARHAIFGPSSFLEVIGFMAEHDRLHLRQAVRTLQAGKNSAHRN
jgi:FMN phosphatase YigB (HAD superfamily)